MDHIDETLTTFSLNAKYSPAIRAACALGKKTLNRYYSKTDDSIMYRVAMSTYLIILLRAILIRVLRPVLHPSFKQAYFKRAKWPTEWIDTADDVLHTAWYDGYAHLNLDTPAPDIEIVEGPLVRLTACSCYVGY